MVFINFFHSTTVVLPSSWLGAKTLPLPLPWDFPFHSPFDAPLGLFGANTHPYPWAASDATDMSTPLAANGTGMRRTALGYFWVTRACGSRPRPLRLSSRLVVCRKTQPHPWAVSRPRPLLLFSRLVPNPIHTLGLKRGGAKHSHLNITRAALGHAHSCFPDWLQTPSTPLG